MILNIMNLWVNNEHCDIYVLNILYTLFNGTPSLFGVLLYIVP